MADDNVLTASTGAICRWQRVSSASVPSACAVQSAFLSGECSSCAFEPTAAVALASFRNSPHSRRALHVAFRLPTSAAAASVAELRTLFDDHSAQLLCRSHLASVGGSLLAAAVSEPSRTPMLWDVHSGAKLHTFPPNASNVRQLRFFQHSANVYHFASLCSQQLLVYTANGQR